MLTLNASYAIRSASGEMPREPAEDYNRPGNRPSNGDKGSVRACVALEVMRRTKTITNQWLVATDVSLNSCTIVILCIIFGGLLVWPTESSTAGAYFMFWEPFDVLLFRHG